MEITNGTICMQIDSNCSCSWLFQYHFWCVHIILISNEINNSRKFGWGFSWDNHCCFVMLSQWFRYSIVFVTVCFSILFALAIVCLFACLLINSRVFTLLKLTFRSFFVDSKFTCCIKSISILHDTTQTFRFESNVPIQIRNHSSLKLYKTSIVKMYIFPLHCIFGLWFKIFNFNSDLIGFYKMYWFCFCFHCIVPHVKLNFDFALNSTTFDLCL